MTRELDHDVWQSCYERVQVYFQLLVMMLVSAGLLTWVHYGCPTIYSMTSGNPNTPLTRTCS